MRERLVKRHRSLQVLQRAEVGGSVCSCFGGAELHGLATRGYAALPLLDWPGTRVATAGDNSEGCRHLENVRERLCGWGRSNFAFFFGCAFVARSCPACSIPCYSFVWALG